MSHHLPRHITAGALVTVALLTGTGAAFAQKAALVQNVDDGIRAPYQESAYGTGCNFSGNCAILFSAVPAGHRRMIEHLSCYASLTGGSITLPMILGTQTSGSQRNYVPVVQSTSGLPVFTANSATLVYYEAGEVPRVDAFSINGSYGAFYCNLSGRDLSLP